MLKLMHFWLLGKFVGLLNDRGPVWRVVAALPLLALDAPWSGRAIQMSSERAKCFGAVAACHQAACTIAAATAAIRFQLQSILYFAAVF